MKDRIRHLRKDLLKMTLDQFGTRIGMKKNSLSQIENGINSVTEQTIISICREFNVREEWLRTGEGSPFVEKTRDQMIEEMVDEIMSSKPEDFRRRFVRALAALDVDGWAALEKFIDSIVEVNKEAPRPAASPQDSSDLTPEEIEIIRQHREKLRRMDA